jgi:hypothetical protein
MDWGPVSKSAPISLLRMAHLATLAHPFLIVLSRAVRDSKYATFVGLETPYSENAIVRVCVRTVEHKLRQFCGQGHFRV